MKVKLFSVLAEKIGPTIELDLPQVFKSSDVLDQIKEKHPDYKDVLNQSLVAVNEEYTNEEDISLDSVDEIAIIPPVSGG
ncbi:MoaD/ThiS family protein [Companilactobacillus mishanensis]|uniref:MoaD/ThiS family protein n=1 Tax=Companilactobacillus mishanensis TaxID=2486008 RepID=UPI0012978877|nr:MoaD/ThiS family protein [Companilactobacillus mishanensis]MQS89953.1 MoaD/ThiS family protein [Companilactobacillus mishanensis]